MSIKISKLSTGYVHIRGQGPCNWTQPPHWPCTEQEIREHAFPEASENFLRAVVKQAEEHMGCHYEE